MNFSQRLINLREEKGWSKTDTAKKIGVSTGANVVVAKSIGSRDKERTEKAIGTAVLFSVLGGIILLLIGVSFAEVFLRLINCPESLLNDAVLYFRLYFIDFDSSTFWIIR